MDTKTLEFVTYCISKLAQQLKLSHKEVYNKLKSSGILDSYIVPSYDVLHTFSSRYLMNDLIDYMQEKGVLEKWGYIILLIFWYPNRIHFTPEIILILVRVFILRQSIIKQKNMLNDLSEDNKKHG